MRTKVPFRAREHQLLTLAPMAALSALQTLVHSAANGSNEPLVTKAAVAEFIPDRRIEDIRSRCEDSKTVP